MSEMETGTLWIVPTPIGNLEDITLRALRVLKEVEVILAEDTRTTRVLLNHYSISTPLRSYHLHNEHARLNQEIEYLLGGVQMALVSDAGTPGISDPGFLLVREALRHGVKVEVLPGACAAITAVVASGIPCERFIYEGFLPQKKGRATRLKSVIDNPCTSVIYESSHRIVRLLQELEELGQGNRTVALARELTKLHEEVLRGSVSDVLGQLKQRDSIRGEFVLVMGSADVLLSGEQE